MKRGLAYLAVGTAMMGAVLLALKPGGGAPSGDPGVDCALSRHAWRPECQKAARLASSEDGAASAEKGRRRSRAEAGAKPSSGPAAPAEQRAASEGDPWKDPQLAAPPPTGTVHPQTAEAAPRKAPEAAPKKVEAEAKSAEIVTGALPRSASAARAPVASAPPVAAETAPEPPRVAAAAPGARPAAARPKPTARPLGPPVATQVERPSAASGLAARLRAKEHARAVAAARRARELREARDLRDAEEFRQVRDLRQARELREVREPRIVVRRADPSVAPQAEARGAFPPDFVQALRFHNALSSRDW